MSGLVGGTSVVAGQTRKGSAGGPVSRKKRSKRITEQPKATGKEKIEERTREQRDRARGDYNVRVAADPSNPARLRPSERTPNKADIENENKKKKAYFDRLRGKGKPTKQTPDYNPKAQYKGIKRKLKPGEFPGEAVGGPKGSIYRYATKEERAQETKSKADAVRKRMAKKKKDSY